MDMKKPEAGAAADPQKPKRPRRRIIDPSHIECIYGPPFPEVERD